MRRVKVGIIGCGVISGIYLTNMTTRFNKHLEVAACADMFVEKAREAAERFKIPKACSVEELLCDSEIEIVVNLTIPAAHYEVNMAVLNASKHVYCEKPLALTMEEGRKIAELAAAKGLLVGNAPDTFMGAGIQTCRKALDEGWIGKPLVVTANMVCHGHEAWHPAPEFYYKKGAGPMMDMGPYYITALVSLLGPIKRTMCFAKKSYDQRTITSTSPLKGKVIDVEVLTHYSGIMEFESGVVANINMSFDMWKSKLPCIEIHGTDGSMAVPDPNMFGGPVKIIRGESMIAAVDGLSTGEAVMKFHSPEVADLYKEVPMPYYYVHNSRGLGILDMAYAIVNGRRHRTNAELAYHVLEALISFDISAKEGTVYNMKSTCERPDSMPVGLSMGELD
ncbi:putative dehydrogenase [Anaerobacterium chartisolvens]|uniref:Putative dehydrogenase n=1 Tax=Anaerobacterium chartisolvens TaxID=1297424 RepID=A0A369B603_9FIRM|nr:Gfo/Idh/MocA family oxidoreductase [Anaerobacterium chartisolvens]RCX16048.1 putative dehydrogenase [Anaerobacterium chartisolvens]